jgi:hypothetical protein
MTYLIVLAMLAAYFGALFAAAARSRRKSITANPTPPTGRRLATITFAEFRARHAQKAPLHKEASTIQGQRRTA